MSTTPAPAPAFASTRVITADVRRLADFYEHLLGLPVVWLNDVFAEVRTTLGTLAIGDVSTVPLFSPGAAEPAANRSVIIEFEVPDADAVHRTAQDGLTDVVQPPSTMPWGNRSLLVRDPDGNLVNVFARPVA